MAYKKMGIQLRAETLSAANMNRLKWSTTLAIIGLPVLTQTLGAMILFSDQYPILVSHQALTLYGAMCSLVIAAGLYAFANRVFLRFSWASQGLEEWESKTQHDAFSFSYRIIVKGALLAFAGISFLGAIQFGNLMGWVDWNLGRSIQLNVESIAALTVTLTYLILLLPTLYIAWTLTPLSMEETEEY